MSLNEKLRDLNYVDRNEWFEVIKDVCRSQSKRAVGFLVVVLLLFTLAGIYFLTSKYQGHDVGDMAAICFDLVICFVVIWGIVNNLRFLRVADSLSTPQQLLLQHEKRIKIIIVLILIFYFNGIYMRPSDRDIEITERLQDLINPK